MGGCDAPEQLAAGRIYTANMTTSHRLMRSLFSGSIALVLSGLAMEVGAQSGAKSADIPDTRASMLLSAAVEAARRSPFHATESSVLWASSPTLDRWLPNAGHANGWSGHGIANDTTLSNLRVFLTTWGAAAVSDYVGFLFTLNWAYSTRGEGGLSLLAGIAAPVLGTAAGAKLAGARFGPSLLGSAAGLGVALLPFAAGAVVDPDDSFVLFIAIPSVIQAAVTTLVVSGYS